MQAPALSERSLPGDEAPCLPEGGRAFLEQLQALRLLDPGSVGSFLAEHAGRLPDLDSAERLGSALIQAGRLTPYQLERVQRGATRGLVLGNYRVLGEVGRGGMSVVYRAEHCLLRRRVAIKVVPIDEDCPPAVRLRFLTEMRVLAELSHPNVVAALDAGEVPPAPGGEPALIYLVLELVEGGDLHEHVRLHGPLPIAEACHVLRQAAAGLQAAHDRHLVHRDVKPSNLLRTPSGQVKLVDFGLVRQFGIRLTDPRSLVGSVEFMAPEQSYDADVGKEADVYGLGATLFWLLTGQGVYPFLPHPGAALRMLQRDEPRRLRALRPDAPQSLDDLIGRLLERNPARRPASPLAVLHALTPFLLAQPSLLLDASPAVPATPRADAHPTRRALLVGDDPQLRQQVRPLLESLGCACGEVGDGLSALGEVAGQPLDLVLLDLRLPDVDGYELCRRLRERADSPNLKILTVSANEGPEGAADDIPRAADDTLPRASSPHHVLARARHLLRLKDCEDRAQALAGQLLLANQQLQHSQTARAAELHAAHDALLFAMARMAESREGETQGHLRRLRNYSLLLARQAAQLHPEWAGRVTERYLEQLGRCVGLHDIGKIGLPDDILLKPGALDAAERALVETHPLIGDRILESLGREHGTALDFLGMARAIVRHHHERFDGLGYPDRLAGEAIPPAARIVAIADVYDALRRERLYKPAISHVSAIRWICERSDGQFDPTLLQALSACQEEFERTYREIPD
jgi:response regulator RpfG family c-di-GMP phosphodiesterase/serine/threonine protein kinase